MTTMKLAPEYMRHPILAKHPELIDMIFEAQQDGATHVQVYLFNLAFFFRHQNEKAELCVANFSNRERKFEWTWPRHTWRECEGIPDEATSIAEILSYIRPEPGRSDRLRLYWLLLKMSILDFLVPGLWRVRPYNPDQRERVPDGVINTAYFRCGDCNYRSSSTAYLGGPFTEACEKCMSHNIGAITEEEYFYYSVTVRMSPYIGPIDLQEMPAGNIDHHNDE